MSRYVGEGESQGGARNRRCSLGTQLGPLPLAAFFLFFGCSTSVVGQNNGAADEDDSEMLGASGSTNGPDGSGGSEDAPSTGGSPQSGGGGTETSSGGADGSGGTDAMTSTGGASGDDCPELHRCVPDVPANWLGPVIALETSNDPPNCPSEFPTLQFDGNSAPSATGSCNCNCTVESASCPSVQLTEFEPDEGNVCIGTPTQTWALTSQCKEKPNEGVFARIEAPKPNITCGSSVEEALEPPVAASFRACSGAVAARNCDGGSCLPRVGGVFNGAHCVYRDGEHNCPDTFPMKRQSFGSIEDTRFCEDACDCQPGSGSNAGTCTATVEVYDLGCGQVLSTYELSSSECADVAGIAAEPPDYEAGSATCEASPRSPSGAVMGADVVTVCCTN